MQTFLNIANNVIFSKNVNELVYDGRLFAPQLEAYRPYRTAYGRVIRQRQQHGFHIGKDDWYPIDAHPGRHPRLNDEVNAATSFAHHTRLLDQQQNILHGREDYQALCRGLEKFPNITKVVILDTFSQFPDYISISCGDHLWYEPRSANEVGLAIAPVRWREKHIFDDNEPELPWDVRGIQNLILAVASHCEKIRELYIGSQTSFPPLTIFRMPEHDLANACAITRRLICLKISCYTPRMDVDEEDIELSSCLHRVLSEAKQLQVLASNKNHVDDPFVGQYWPCLTTLELGVCCVFPSNLREITRAHTDTLRELGLRNVYLEGDEGWESLGIEMGQFLKLHCITLGSLADQVTEDQIGSPYITNEGMLATACNVMQWVPRGRLQLEKEEGLVNARLIAAPVLSVDLDEQME